MWHFSKMMAEAVSDGLPRRSLGVALFVGAILNIINQGDAFLGFFPINWFKVVLTFCVPYAVYTWGAVSSKIRTSSNREQEP